ncbi:Fic/DOC family protein [Microbacterium hydrocarbonoxydans]|uniref:Fic/DOC family protein n=1 Tax=Microbacterium hydrocarbonoxydans TaxID=273678 RepID=A0A1H4IYC1_9MICO|nr:Fic/DOC family protein [Microbacterium hydrocarbonoxydans]
MINNVTIERIEVLCARYRELVARHPGALVQIARSETAESVHQSNAIENSTLTLEDTEKILAGGLPSAAHDLREVFEASNLARVTEDLLNPTAEDAGGMLTVDRILHWHASLLSGIRDDVAGRFRQGDEWVRVGSHLGANPLFVRELMDRALERYVTGPPVNAIERIAWFHCEFEVIHPFVDGNGRIGRVLMNHQLLGQGLPPVIVRARNRRAEYYPALDAYSRANRHDEMTRLLALLVLEALHKRISLLTSPEVIRLSEWARSVGMRGNVAANRAKRQTLPAFRVRDSWMLAADHRG